MRQDLPIFNPLGIPTHFKSAGNRCRSNSSDFNHNLVQRAEMLTLAQLDRPALHVATMASKLGVTERTLRKAFRRTQNLSPCRHLRFLRLSRARQALLAAHDEVATVTEIATSFGFAELGRFAVEYRKALARYFHTKTLPKVAAEIVLVLV